MHKNYFREVIDEKPALFAAMLRFNGAAPSEDAAPLTGNVAAALQDNLPQDCLEELWRHGPSRKHLQVFATPVAPFWDFSEESRCLALLEPDTLDELALFYGTSLHALEIARTIMGKEIIQLREALGERAHTYALQRGQYQMPSGRAFFGGRHRELPLMGRVILHGREALGIVMSDWPQTLQNRVRYEAPADTPTAPDLRRELWFDIKKILLKEVAPAWAPCFT